MHRNGVRPLRVAIVGLGPKGLFALERLLDRAADTATGPIAVEIFEPHSVLGAGPVYDPDQPDYLRMNLDAAEVTIWPAGSAAVPATEQLSFTQWQRANLELSDCERYPPRAEMGRYLAAGAALLVEHAAQRIEVAVHRREVAAVTALSSGWQVAAEDAGGEFDEVLVATGHAHAWDGMLANGWNHAAPLVERVFPVEANLNPIPRGARVAVRGYALTFIDAALALTEGRGGRFEPVTDGTGLLYRKAGTEPAKILPFSRTGEPMVAKPQRDEVATDETWRELTSQARERISKLPPDGEAVAALEAIVTTLAGIRHGVESDAANLGVAWRALYPAVVERFGADGIGDAEWPAFRVVATQMERYAFGPPAINAAKLEALIRAGIVDPTHCRGGRIETEGAQSELCSQAGRTPIDIVLDAVLAPPGAIGLDSPLLRGMLTDGVARVQRGRRGLEVAADASCVAARGGLSYGLSAYGRPTEDSVIGNDTLNRSLHPQLDLWADRVIARSREPAAIMPSAG